MRTHFKKSSTLFIVSGLVLVNAVLLNGACWALKDTYYMDVTFITSWMTWSGIFLLLVAMCILMYDIYKLIKKTIKNFIGVKKQGDSKSDIEE